MPLEPDVGIPTAPSGPLDDVLAGVSCVRLAEGDTQVSVGWLRAGGDGLIVTASVDEGVVGHTRFWCDAQQWCDWLAPSLPVSSWDALPPAWQASAASLTLAVGSARADTSPEAVADAQDVGDVAERGSGSVVAGAAEGACDTASWPRATTLAPAQVETAWRVGMVLHRAGRRLALMYLDGATAWLRERCRQATPGDTALDPSGLPTRRCALAAGWATLPRAQCERLQVGDAVLLDVAADIASGEYWLLDGDHAIAMRDGMPLDHRVIPFDGTDAGPPGGTLSTGAASHPDAAIVRLSALVAERQFPIPLLTAWRTGSDATFQCEAAACALPADRVTLLRDDSPWATGRLLRFEDGRLAVCIDGMIGAPAASHAIEVSPSEHGTPACDDFPSDISGRDRMGVHPETT
ncbi:hypothetical protein [Pandoraea terrigena]|uniref:Translocation protein in type III secretion n=1 Tax=Pandoraea terrigena TaxID=2508292 RepID=A0A5E4YGH3_9BURK|nr:hypothetical protein [Pandoraea terrigena]VVE47542.1 translocation protein in type III secretion [Pandoraea terrigena]